MKLNDVLSSSLPEIDVAVKECINLGQWLLFKSTSLAQEDPDGHPAFFLKADAEIFELDSRGAVIKSISRAGLNVSVDEVFYFADLPRPSSLSNALRDHRLGL